MAIGADSLIHYFGVQDSLGNTPGAVANNSFSVVADLNAWTNDDDAILASAVLECAFSIAPDANSSISLFAALNAIQTTNDQLSPSANFEHVYIGSFPVKDVTVAQFIPIDIALPNTKTSQIYQFYIRNNTGQTVSASWDLHITPKALGLHG